MTDAPPTKDDLPGRDVPARLMSLGEANQLAIVPDGAASRASRTAQPVIVTEDSASWNPLHIPRARAKMLDFATRQELEPDTQDVGYSARLFAQVAIPQRNPGEVDHYSRRNGNVVLTLSPGLITNKDGTRARKYPHGIFPRLALTHIATEAFITKSPTIDLGRSMRAFLGQLGIEYSGRNADTVKTHLQALFSAQIAVEGLEVTEDGHGTTAEYYQIAKSVHLWWANKESPTEEGLWASEVKLSKDFYDSIIRAPIPVDLKALRALGGSSLRIDLYLWATFRMFYLTTPTRIKWADLNNQFGAQFSRLRAFRKAFTDALEEVKIVYPQLNAEATEDYLILRPSLTHVRSNKPYRQVTATPQA